MSGMDKKRLEDIIRWQRIGCIVTKVAQRFEVSLPEALDMFYKSKTCRRFHDESTGLYLYGDLYLVDELAIELQQ